MLTESERTLIFTAVDGELSAAETESFRKLVAESAEALSFFHVVQQQSRQLHALPRIPAPGSVATGISQAIGRGRGADIERRSVRVGRTGWIPYVVAASVLLAVAAITFHAANTENEAPVANRTEPIQVKTPAKEKIDADIALLPAPGDFGHDPHVALPEEIVRLPQAREEAPMPKPAARTTPETPTVFGAPIVPRETELTEVQLRLPQLVSLSSLQQPEVLAETAKLWDVQRTLKLDLFVRDSAKAVETLKTGLAQFQVQTAVEEATQERLQKPLNLPYALFCDQLTQAEFRSLLTWMSRRSESEGFPPAAVLHASIAGPVDGKDVRELFGNDLGWLPRKKIADTKPPATVDEIAGQLQAKKRSAMLVTLMPSASRSLQAASREVKQFVALHEDRKPDRIGFLLVIRPSS